MKIRVECYSGYKGDQRPTRFYLGKRAYQVREVKDQWYGPKDAYFKCLADDGNYYILSHRRLGEGDYWVLESFRKGANEKS